MRLDSHQIHDAERLFELSRDLLATLDRDGRFLRVNPAWERVLGWPADELLDEVAIDLLHPEDLARTLSLTDGRGAAEAEVVEFENRYRCKDGAYRWLEWNARRSGDIWYAVARDVTERKMLEEQALVDPVTGLANRAAFVDRLAVALARLGRRKGSVAVLFVDLDDFKLINDAHGHEVGDRFLRAVADRLRRILRGEDTVARFGGDEFLILVEDGTHLPDLAVLGSRVVTAFERPFPVGDAELWATGSVGVAASTRSDVTPDSLLREADIAMYRAKAAGSGRCELFDDTLRAEVDRRVRVERDLRQAIERGELEVHYQPIVALPETSVTRCEALVRWRHPERGLLLPEDFVPLAEDTRFINRLGAWVLREACLQARAWRDAGHHIGITVNLSTRQLAQADLADQVGAILRETGLPPHLLCLEVTETAIMERTDRVIAGLTALRAIGVRIAMDDFGSGYSSLTYLKALPLDVIKIDKSFVRGIVDNPEDHAIVGAIIGLARETGLAVIGEGVETEALHAELVGLGCPLAQGFLYDPPKPAAELRLDGYSSRVRVGTGDPLVIREFMRQIGIPARIRP